MLREIFPALIELSKLSTEMLRVRVVGMRVELVIVPLPLMPFKVWLLPLRSTMPGLETTRVEAMGRVLATPRTTVPFSTVVVPV